MREIALQRMLVRVINHHRLKDSKVEYNSHPDSLGMNQKKQNSDHFSQIVERSQSLNSGMFEITRHSHCSFGCMSNQTFNCCNL